MYANYVSRQVKYTNRMNRVACQSLKENFPRKLNAVVSNRSHWSLHFILTAHVPAAVATRPPDIIIGLMPRVLLKIIPLIAPAATLFVASSMERLANILRPAPGYD
jgi:hypothetical protein